MQAALRGRCHNRLLSARQHVRSAARYQQCMLRPLAVLQPRMQALQACSTTSSIHGLNRRVRYMCCCATHEHSAGGSSSSGSSNNSSSNEGSVSHGRYRRTSRRTVSSAPTETGSGTGIELHLPAQQSLQLSAPASTAAQQHQPSSSSAYQRPALGALLLQQTQQPQQLQQLGYMVVGQPIPPPSANANCGMPGQQQQAPASASQQQQQQQLIRGVQPPTLTAQQATPRMLPRTAPDAADQQHSMRHTDVANLLHTMQHADFATLVSGTADAAAASGVDQADSAAAALAAPAGARARRRSSAVSPGVPSAVVAVAIAEAALLQAPSTRRRRRCTTPSSRGSSSSAGSSSSKASESNKRATPASSGSSKPGTESSSRRSKKLSSSSAAAACSTAAVAVSPPLPPAAAAAAAALVRSATAPAVGSTSGGEPHALSRGAVAAPAAARQQLYMQQQQQQQQQQSQPSLLQRHQQPLLPLSLPEQQQQQQHEQGVEQQVLLQLQELLADKGIQLPELRFGQHRTLCPECQGGSSREDCFALSLAEAGSAVWLCHRASCGCRGGVTVRRGKRRSRSSSSSSSSSSVGGSNSVGVTDVAKEQQAAAVPPDTSRLRPLSRELLSWLQGRGISQAVLRRNKVSMERRCCRALGDAWVDHIAFPFYSGGRVVNVKYRALPKHFQQSAKGQQVFYGLDDIQGSPVVLIVEGELDKLSVEEATRATAVLSVPAGASAPPQLAAGMQQQQNVTSITHSCISSSGQAPRPGDKKYAYVQQAMPLLQHCGCIVIGVDADAAGWHTAQQLAGRLGVQRCWWLPWPAAGPAGAAALQRVACAAAANGLHVDVAAGLGCKDANDVLLCYGKEVLKLYIRDAPEKFPLQ